MVAGEERHATIDRALRLLGLGTASLEPVTADANGAIDLAGLHRVLAAGAPGPTIVCLQAGNVNTGACDDLAAAIAAAHAFEAWVHVDGAFGLWAAAARRHARLVVGIETADSWATDGHNGSTSPTTRGYAFCAHPTPTPRRWPTPPVPRGLGTLALAGRLRPRVVAQGPWLRDVGRAAQLGRSGVSDLVERCCALARRFADQLEGLEGAQSSTTSS